MLGKHLWAQQPKGKNWHAREARTCLKCGVRVTCMKQHPRTGSYVYCTEKGYARIYGRMLKCEPA